MSVKPGRNCFARKPMTAVLSVKMTPNTANSRM